MVDIIEFFKKVYTKVGIEIIGIISIVMVLQYLVGIPDAMKDFEWFHWILFVLVIAAFVDAMINITMNIYGTIRFRLVEITKKCDTYSIEDLEKETKTTITDEGIGLIQDLKKDIDEKRELKRQELQAQLDALNREQKKEE